MNRPTIRTVSGMDITLFGIDELLSLRKEIDEELRRRKESNGIRLPIDSFDQHARRDRNAVLAAIHPMV